MRELAAVAPPGEPRADCAHCPLSRDHSGADPSFPWAFDPGVRCCTYHPYLPNYLVGGALERGGTSERVIRARMEDPEGVVAMGIAPQKAHYERYHATSRVGFGRDRSLRCPYWVPGDLGCGIWQDRGHVCRTWFCRHDEGREGMLWWRRFSKVLRIGEEILAAFCIREGDPPAAGAPSEAWVAFYVGCATRVRAMTPDEVEALRSEDYLSSMGEVGESPRLEPIPDIVIPSVWVIERQEGTVWIASGMNYDALRLPTSVFLFFSKLDGHTPWRIALAQTNAETSEPLSEHDVLELYRVDCLRGPEPGDLRGDELIYPDVIPTGEGTFVRITWK